MDVELSIILPCRNEQDALDGCLEQIRSVVKSQGISSEIIVSDSSTDGSPEIARRYDAVLIKHDKDGYGTAILEGCRKARGRYLFIADPDGSYDFREIPAFLKCLKEGHDFVIGNRFRGRMDDGAMPWHHRYIGNPLLSWMTRVFFGHKVGDVHCGMRAISRETFDRLQLRTTGMEFATEMVIQAVKNGLKIEEVPVDYRKRKGQSKLRSFSDGWRHLRFMLLYSPFFLFFLPGLVLFLVGAVMLIGLGLGNPSLFGITFYYHPMFYASVLMIIGYQMIIFAFFAKIYAVNHLGERNQTIESLFRYLTLEKGCLIGAVLAAAGLLIYILILAQWLAKGVGPFNFGPLQEIKPSIVALTLVALGAQTVVSSFMLSILGIKER